MKLEMLISTTTSTEKASLIKKKLLLYPAGRKRLENFKQGKQRKKTSTFDCSSHQFIRGATNTAATHLGILLFGLAQTTLESYIIYACFYTSYTAAPYNRQFQYLTINIQYLKGKLQAARVC